METIIVKPEHEILKKYVEYFLFLNKTDSHLVNYTTFPNSNVCLAIYRGNSVRYNRNATTNHCSIKPGRENFCSRMYGFHNMPFHVDIEAELQQICIVFRAAALRAFTKESLNEIGNTDRAFEQLFGVKNQFVLEQLFNESNSRARARQLERLLLHMLDERIPSKLQEALHLISVANQRHQDIGIETICKQMNISDTTLFRLFKTHLGQNPQKFLKTIRFRKVLTDILNQNNPLTAVGFQNHYYDQAHFINDFKTFAGLSPKKLVKQVAVHQKDLTWIYQEKPDE